jgi:DNA polymerase
MMNAVCTDGRVRGLLQFYGANRTGRWAGRLVQVQNLPRNYIEELDFARDLVKNRDVDSIALAFGNVPDTLSQLIRTAFVPAIGHKFVVADFSAIEARVIAWMAGETWRQDVFRTHGKIYEASASAMFGVPIERIKKGNPEYALRQKGKIAELALGYGGSTGALIAMGAAKMGLSEDELPDIVQRWRKSNQNITRLWYRFDDAAVRAIRTCAPVGANGCIFRREGDFATGQDFLTVQLPSGRKLFYAHPYIGKNRFDSDSIHYYGVDQTSKKWKDLETYGGKLTENIVQAVARDCLSVTLARLEKAGYQTVMHIHDEAVIDCPEERADLGAACELMRRPISWAPGLILNAAGFVGNYYKKD